MKELELQKFLRSYSDPNLALKELESKYAISSKRHSKYPELILFKYNQIESDFKEKIVCESRGIILLSNDNWNIVSYPFDKFFNNDESLAATIDWSTAVVQEKCDGSLMTLYHYNNEWLVSSSGSPCATGQVNDSNHSFATLFWNTFHSMGAKLPANKNFCYMFELTSQLNRVVVVHNKPKLTLIGARDLISGEEFPIEMISNDYLNIQKVKTYNLDSLQDIIKTFDNSNPLESEGYIVVDAMFNRQKIKDPKYIQLHRAKDGFSTRAFVELAKMGEVSEFVSAFPEFKDRLDVIKVKYEELLTSVESNYNTIKHIETQKEFAFAALKFKGSSAMFAVRAGKFNSFKQFFAKINTDSLIEMLELKNAI